MVCAETQHVLDDAWRQAAKAKEKKVSLCSLHDVWPDDDDERQISKGEATILARWAKFAQFLLIRAKLTQPPE